MQEAVSIARGGQGQQALAAGAHRGPPIEASWKGNSSYRGEEPGTGAVLCAGKHRAAGVTINTLLTKLA